MKKLLLLLTLTLSTSLANAQFEINENSHVGLIFPTTNQYVLKVDGSTGTLGGLHVQRMSSSYNTPGTPYTSAIYGHINHQSAGFSQGIRGYATSNSSTGIGRTYGVYGAACGATEGYNYGVFGVLCGYNKGAGVYGGTQGGDYGQALDKLYAGYFNGPVKVQGNLTVTGNISGVLLSAPSSVSPISQAISEKFNASLATMSRLKTLEVSTFYHEHPTPPTRSEATLSVDTAETIFPLTAMEQQVLSKQHYGLSADQLEEVFPDLVYENEDGTKSINYVEMVPILVQAINELSAKVTALEGGSGAAHRIATKAEGIEENIQILSLGQNRPNPFGTTTDIEVTVPESVQSAFVYVYDLQGQKVQQIDITGRGKQTVQLNAAELTDGMYLYSLIADGLVVKTRRMIVEK